MVARVGDLQAYPHRWEADYRRLALAEVKAVAAEVDAAIAPALRAHADVIDGRRTDDVDQSVVLALVAAIEALRQRAVGPKRAAESLARSLLNTARGVVAHIDRGLRAQVKAVVGIDIVSDDVSEAMLTSWAAQNARLITSIRSRAVTDLSRWLPGAVREGWSTRDITREITRRVEGIEGWRARFWARDQVGKLNGQVTEAKHTALGITSYQWVDAGDERVRATHRAHDGRVFAWSQPPAITGHPGHDYQCRCTSRPVFSDQTVAELRRRHEERRTAEAIRRARAAPLLTGDRRRRRYTSAPRA